MPDPLKDVFAAVMAGLIGDASGQDRLGVAVSGGPDSMALLDLAIGFAPSRVEAATVDHGLRPESAGEAEMVARWCGPHAIPHVTLRPESPITGSVQAEARDVRYALLDGWMRERGIGWLLTAHHADDQLETMLMRLNRASGVAGLAGVRARRGRVLRPLLGIRKTMLEDHARERGLPFIIDPSNGDDRFDRARLRRSLAEADWLDPVAAARSAAALGDAEAALEWSVDALHTTHVERDGEAIRLSVEGLPREYQRRLLRRALAEIAPEFPEPRGEQIDHAVIRLHGGNKISLGACIATGGAIWTICRAPQRRAC